MAVDSAAVQLETLARAKFQNLTATELKLLHAAAIGEWATAGLPNADASAYLPEFSENGDIGLNLQPWGPERNVKAELIRWLCVWPAAKVLVAPSGLQLRGARVVGPLNFEGAQIPFQLDLRSCRLTHAASFLRCTIPNLSMTGSWTRGVNAIGLVVSGSVTMNLGFHAEGEIDLVGAKIDGTLDFMDATILNAPNYAIVADNIKATNVFLGAYWSDNAKGFRAEGTVWFPGATISGDFGGYGAEIIRGQELDEALSLERATVGGSLTLGNKSDNLSDKQRQDEKRSYPRFKVDGVVDLRGTRCQTFEDSDWTGPIRLDGFTYEITSRQWDAKTRVPWLERDTTGATQPYHQLAKYFEGIGRTSDGRQVRIALEKMLYRQDDNPLKFLKPPIGYGYRPENALIGVAGACIIGSVVYWRSYRMGIMVPSDKDAATTLRQTGRLPAHYPRFQPFIASLENTFPLVKLGQAAKWQPDPNPAPPLRGNVFQRLAQLLTLQRSLRWLIWAQILLGWLLATLFLAAVTGLVQH